MLDHLKAQQAAMGRRETTRLMVLVGLAVAAAAAMVGTRSCAGTTPTPSEPAFVPVIDETAGQPVPVERDRILAVGDGPSTHGDEAYERGALDYVLSIVGRPLAEVPRHLSTADLAAIPFAEAAGRSYEARGKVLDLASREFRTPSQRLWTLVVEGKDGARFVVLKQGLATDPREGRPRSATADAEWIEEGDTVLVRGVYLQRRAGTVGETVLAEPAPVLVLVQMRRSPEPQPAIEDLSKADWNEVEDRLLADSRRWQEPALFQSLQWAEARGAKQLAQDIRSGALPWKAWDRKTFEVWQQEIEVSSPVQVRPFTDPARGKVWRFTGLIGSIVYEGWDTLPPNPQGVDHLYVWDIAADDYTVYGSGISLRCFSPFPPDAFPGITGMKGQPVTAYGIFLKNYTYVSRQRSSRSGTPDRTVPSFILLHVEPFEIRRDQSSLWIIAGSMVLLAALFYLTLIRGERRESKRMEVYRRGLRQRMRKVGQGPMAPAKTDAKDPAPRTSAEASSDEGGTPGEPAPP